MLSRRQFLQAAGAAGVLAIPTLAGYGLMQSGQGEFPPIISPYAATEPKRPLSSGPILVVTGNQEANPLGTYLLEILRAEGLNCFQTAPLAGLNTATLERFDLVLLAEAALNQSQVALLEHFVAKGGQIIAMRPAVQLGRLLGVEPVTGNTVEGYLQFATDHPLGRGLLTNTLQYHGLANHYRLAGAQAVAWLTNRPNSPSEFPAVALHNYGQGQAAMWAFDLARSVIFMRQGNPAWSNQERDGADGIRAHDAFANWLDLERLAIPQADEQMRLLSRLITHMLADVVPLPRLWYFPGAAERMLIATGDSHQNVAFAIEDVLTRVERRGGHMSIYYTPPPVTGFKRTARKARWWAAELPLIGEVTSNPNTLPSPGLVAGWRTRGHEFTFHPEVEAGVEAGFYRYWQEFTAMGYGPVSPTVRTHRILWSGWVESARFQASCGLRMNLDYYHIGPVFQNGAGDWKYGHFTGSGLPMKFVDERGRILNNYQQLTQLVDEHLLDALGGWAKLSADEAVEVSKMLLTSSHTAVGAQFHIDPFHNGGFGAEEARRWLEGTLDYAAAQHIPIWSAAAWLHFIEVRNAATLKAVTWQPTGQRLSFSMTAQADPTLALTVMVPSQHKQARLIQVEVDGQPVSHHERTVDGLSYGWLSIDAGAHQVAATYA